MVRYGLIGRRTARLRTPDAHLAPLVHQEYQRQQRQRSRSPSYSPSVSRSHSPVGSRSVPGRRRSVLAALAVGLLVVFWVSTGVRDPELGVEPPEPLPVFAVNVLVVGDWGRDGLFNQSLVARQMGTVGQSLEIDFVISTGDNFYERGLKNVDDPQFSTSFMDVYTAPSLQKPWYAVLGNHDYMGDALAQMDVALSQRDSRWFCRRQFQLKHPLCGTKHQGLCNSSVEFFFIDTSPFVDDYWMPHPNYRFDWRGLSPRDQQLKYQLQSIDQSLKQSAAVWKVVVGHHTIRSFCYHGDTIELVFKLAPILEINNVDLYLNGHDHCLQHIKRPDSKVHYVTSGGGSRAWQETSEATAGTGDGLRFIHPGQGFAAVSFNTRAMLVDFYDVFGNRVYSFQLTKN